MILWLQLSVKKKKKTKRSIKGNYQKEIELMEGKKKNYA